MCVYIYVVVCICMHAAGDCCRAMAALTPQDCMPSQAGCLYPTQHGRRDRLATKLCLEELKVKDLEGDLRHLEQDSLQ